MNKELKLWLLIWSLFVPLVYILGVIQKDPVLSALPTLLAVYAPIRISIGLSAKLRTSFERVVQIEREHNKLVAENEILRKNASRSSSCALAGHEEGIAAYSSGEAFPREGSWE